MRYAFILPFSGELLDLAGYRLVGIDRGALIATKKGIQLDYAIGDFDSVTDAELALIKNNTKNLVKLNPEKDYTDTEYAIRYFKDADEILIYGGISGKRADHLYANINLCLKYPYITFVDDTTKIMAIPEYIKLNDEYFYYSFFASHNSKISLKGFKYELEDYTFKNEDNLCISNEINNEEASICFKGQGIMILSKYDNEKE